MFPVCVFAASQSVGFHEPHEMLQVLSLRLLSQAESYPISVYGIFAVRDDLEPLRNYVFNRTRDDPVLIDKLCMAFFLSVNHRACFLF
jgi:hypothetical protein